MIKPGSTIGIVGGGQLGRMLAIAAAELGYHTHIYCPEADSPAFHVANTHTVAGYEDFDALEKFAKSVDVVTIEFENIPIMGLAHIGEMVPVHPSPEVLAICQHRVQEKSFIQQLGIGTAAFEAVDSESGMKEALAKIGTSSVLKTARMGYDGKGQWKIKTPADAPAIKPGEYILEKFVDFTMEISVIVARSEKGETAAYVPVENIHKNHILHQTIAPARIDAKLQQEAREMAVKIAKELELVGLLAVEMFVTPGGLLVNELAPRPHNSGHWTIDACPVSQFEQTVRAICGLKLGETRELCPAVMTNLIGAEVNAWEEWLKKPNTRVHLYGKKEVREGRKMGHVTELKTNLS